MIEKFKALEEFFAPISNETNSELWKILPKPRVLDNLLKEGGNSLGLEKMRMVRELNINYKNLTGLKIQFM